MSLNSQEYVSYIWQEATVFFFLALFFYGFATFIFHNLREFVLSTYKQISLIIFFVLFLLVTSTTHFSVIMFSVNV